MSSSEVLPTSSAGAGRYGAWPIAAHWALFVLLVVVGTLGLLHDSWPKHSQAFSINVHALFGLSLWIILILRFVGKLIIRLRRRRRTRALPAPSWRARCT